MKCQLNNWTTKWVAISGCFSTSHSFLEQVFKPIDWCDSSWWGAGYSSDILLNVSISIDLSTQIPTMIENIGLGWPQTFNWWVACSYFRWSFYGLMFSLFPFLHLSSVTKVVFGGDTIFYEFPDLQSFLDHNLCSSCKLPRLSRFIDPTTCLVCSFSPNYQIRLLSSKVFGLFCIYFFNRRSSRGWWTESSIQPSSSGFLFSPSILVSAHLWFLCSGSGYLSNGSLLVYYPRVSPFILSCTSVQFLAYNICCFFRRFSCSFIFPPIRLRYLLNLCPLTAFRCRLSKWAYR